MLVTTPASSITGGNARAIANCPGGELNESCQVRPPTWTIAAFLRLPSSSAGRAPPSPAGRLS